MTPICLAGSASPPMRGEKKKGVKYNLKSPIAKPIGIEALRYEWTINN